MTESIIPVFIFPSKMPSCRRRCVSVPVPLPPPLLAIGTAYTVPAGTITPTPIYLPNGTIVPAGSTVGTGGLILPVGTQIPIYGIASFPGLLTGPPGPSIVNVNETVFVDSKFGNDTTGVRDDMTHPFATLSAALAAAKNGDTIYVQSGVYTDNLVLLDGIDFYFALGAVMTDPGPYLFTDNGNSVSVIISGFGDFIATTSVMKLTGSSLVYFEAQDALSTGADIFVISNTGNVSAIVDIDLQNAIAVSGNVITVDGGIDLAFRADRMISASSIINVTTNASGDGIFRISESFNGPGATTAFNLTSDNFALAANIDYFNPATTGGAIIANIPFSLGNSRYQFDFQLVEVTGPLLVTNGDSVQPTYNQPQITLNCQRVFALATSSPIFTIGPTLTTISIDNIFYSTNTNVPAFLALEGATLDLNLKTAIGNPAYNSIFIQAQGSIGPTSIVANIQSVTLPGPLLDELGPAMSNNIVINSADLTLGTGQSAMTLYGNDTIEIVDLGVITLVPSTGSPVPVINQVGGSTSINITSFAYSVENSIGILANGSGLSLAGQSYTTNNISTTLLVINATTTINVSTITATNGGDVLRATAPVSIITNVLSTNSPSTTGTAIELSGYASLTGYIGAMSTSYGPLVTKTGLGSINVVFNTWSTNVPAGVLTAPAIHVVGGDNYFDGNVLNTTNSSTGVQSGDGSNKTHFNFRVGTVYSYSANNVFILDATLYGESVVFIHRLHAATRGGTITESCFNIISGYGTIQGGAFHFLPTTPAVMFIIAGTSDVAVDIAGFDTNSSLLTATTTKIASFHIGFGSIRAGGPPDLPPISTTTPDAFTISGPAVCDISGCIISDGNGINITDAGPETTVRLTGLTLVTKKDGKSIRSDNPVNVIAQPSLTNTPYTDTVTIIGSLIVNDNVK